MPEATDMQQMEMDMVQGMYESFELVSSDPPTYSILLAASADDPPELKVTVSYPTEDYPESAPCSVQVDSIAKNRRIQTQTINKDVAATVEDNPGMHVVLLALQQIQEFLSHSAEEAEKAELIRRGEAQEAAAVEKHGAVAEDPTIRVGTAVTRELFAEWSRKRAAEKAKARAEREKVEYKAAASKLTGRQLWDSTLRTADWELFGAGEGDDAGEDVDFDAMAETDEDNFDLDDDDD